jgi:hypothetical protein
MSFRALDYSSEWLRAIRNVRHEISREFNNDPARLIAHYIELQRRIEKSKIVQGPDDADPTPPDADVAPLGR